MYNILPQSLTWRIYKASNSCEFKQINRTDFQKYFLLKLFFTIFMFVIRDSTGTCPGRILIDVWAKFSTKYIVFDGYRFLHWYNPFKLYDLTFFSIEDWYVQCFESCKGEQKCGHQSTYLTLNNYSEPDESFKLWVS